MENGQFTMDNLQWTIYNGQYYAKAILSIVHCKLSIVL